MNIWRLDYADLCKKGLRLTLVAALLSGMLYTAGVRTAHAAEVTVNDWDSLYDAFINSASGTTILLGANITQPSGALTVPSATDLTLDLAGNTLSITSLSNSAIYVNAGTALTIEDSSVDGSGRLVAMSNRQSYAGIGGGPNSAAGTITINGGIVSATGGEHAAGIGSGFNAAGGTININGGVVNVTGGLGSAGIGGGYGSTGVTINITGGTVTANGGSGGAGIGGREATINITGGTVTANGGSDGAGIGGGYYSAGGTININGGVVSATGGLNGAGIGGGAYESGGTIQITGGVVTATSGDYGAGIGGGRFGGGGTIDIQGGTVIPSTGGSHNISVIGAGDGAPDPSFDLVNGGTITIPEGYQLIIPEGVTVENSGTINGNGTITGGGNINNTGTITVDVAGPEVDGVAFELRYDLNGGSGSIQSVIVYAATLQEVGVALPQPVREGFEFEGWYTQPNGGDEVTATYAISGDMDLFAHWKELNPPTVTLSSSAGDPVNGAFEVTATFSEEVTGFTVEDIEVTNGTAGNFSEVNGATYTFDVTSTADGQVTVEIPAGVAQDTVGRGNTVSAPLTRVYDGIAPTVTLSGSAGEPLNGPFEVTAAFSKEVTGFEVGDIEVTNGTAGDFHAENSWTYTFVVTPTADGTVTVEIPAGVAADTAGNGNIASTPLTRTYDGTAPTVTLSSSAGDPMNVPFEVTAAFSEGVTGFEVGDIEVTNGTAGDFHAENSWTYTFVVTPTVDGTVTVEIPAGMASDAAGNGNIASAPLTRVYDGIAPTVTLSSTAGDPLNGPFEVTVAFGEGVTGFEVGDIEVTNGTAGDFHAENSWTYTFVVTPTADGPVTVEIPAGVAADTAGNGNTASLPLTRMHDGTAPTVTLSSTAGDPLNGSFEVTAAFSKEITGFEVGDIEVTNGTAGDFHAENSWTYTFVVTPTADGELTVEIPAGVASDTAGNGNTASLPLTRMYDGTAPTVTLSSSAGEPLNGPFEVTAAFSEGVTGFEVGDIEVTNGTAGDFHAENGWTYTFVVTPTADGEVTVEIPAGVASDAAGNENIASAPLTRTYDGTAPTVTLSSSAGEPLNGPFEVTAAFSEGITGFGVGDIEVTNGTAGDFHAENGWTYTFVVTPTADGEVTVEIPAGVASDAAGNENIASAPLTRTYDGTVPTVTLSSSAGEPLNGPFEVTAAFSEGITGFGVGDIEVTNGTAGDFSAENGWTYTFVVTPTADGTVTVEVPAGVASDTAGNGNTVSAPLTRMYDGTAPTVTLSSSAGDPLNGPFEVTATFSKEITGFEVGDIEVTNGTAGDFHAENGWTYTFVVTPTADGPVTVEIPAGGATDAAGNGNIASAPLTRTYDGTAPVVMFSPDSNADPAQRAETTVTVDHADDLSLLAYVWTPSESAPETDAPEWQPFISGNKVAQTSGNGDWYVHIHAVDRAGNEVVASSGPFLLDNVPPVIVLKGENPFYVPVGQSYAEPGAEATDNIDGAIDDNAVTVNGEVDTTRLGVYEVRYETSDRAGNAAMLTRSVYVYDGDAPVIHLNGDNPMVVSEGSTFTDPGATAYDAQDGDLTDAITVTGAVYTDRSGTYDLVYHVSDSSGNAAPTVTRTVYVIMPPVITLLGSSSMTITAGEPFIDPGATAADGYYGDLTDRIVVTGTVLANQPGSYALRYNVQNPIGQTAAEMVRTVTVESADDPVEPGGPNKPDKPDQSGGLTGPNTPNDSDEPASLFTANIWLGNLLAKVRMTTETSPDGQPVTRLFLTPEQVAQVFSDARTEAVIAVEGLGPAVKISMPAAPLLGVLHARPDVRLRVIVNGSGLLVPLSAIGALSEEATVTVTIAEAAEAASDIMEKTIRSKGAVPLLTHPVSFGLDTDGKAVDEWNAIYRERTISLSAAIDPERTTAVWIDARGELHFAPSTFASDSDGSLTATIRSPQDGFYTIVVSNKSFADIGAHWAQTEIGLLANKRIVEGQPNGGFTPDAPITRAEFAALLVRALGLPDSSKTRRSFTDVRTSDWYASAVGAAEQAGVIRGFEDGSFRPDGDITREQMAAMIARALAFAGAALPAADATVLESFTDSRDIADWAAQATANLAESGIVQGMSDTAFVPRAAASRAQSVVILKRMLQYLHFID